MPTPAPEATPPDDPIFVSAKQASTMLGLSRNQTYMLLDDGQIESQYFGKRRLVRRASVLAFADSLPTERVRAS